jgi:hypothetical protein
MALSCGRLSSNPSQLSVKGFPGRLEEEIPSGLVDIHGQATMVNISFPNF